MAYESFLISAFNTGLYSTTEPWKAPFDAFVMLENARVANGVLEKRLGTSQVAQMKHGTSGVTNAITGLYFHKYPHNDWLVACDKARVNVLDMANDVMLDCSGGSDIFDASDYDFHWFWQKDNKTYMTNGYDGIYYIDFDSFDPDSVTAAQALSMTLDSGSMTSVGMMFGLVDRMIVLDIIEGGVHRPYRIRYSQALTRGLTPSFTDGNYLDFPTDDTPITGRQIGKYIYVWFEKSLWAIRPSGDTTLPIRTEKLRGDLGSKSRNVCIPFEKGVMTIGHKHLIFFDGYETRYLNMPKLREILADYNWASLKYSWGHFDEITNRIYITLTTSGTSADRILEYDIEQKTFGLHKVAANCLATYNGAGVPTWDNADEYFASDGATLDEMPISGGYGGVLGEQKWYMVYGGQDGYLYRLFTGGTDNGSVIDFTATTARLNPYSERGQRCALGRVAVLVDNDSSASFTLSLLKNTSTTAYKSQTISCDLAGDKGWVSMHAGGEIGNSHQLKFYNSASSNRPRIHAIWLEMEPAGHIDP